MNVTRSCAPTPYRNEAQQADTRDRRSQAIVRAVTIHIAWLSTMTTMSRACAPSADRTPISRADPECHREQWQSRRIQAGGAAV